MATQSVGSKTVRRNRAGASGSNFGIECVRTAAQSETPPCSMNAKNSKNLSCPNWGTRGQIAEPRHKRDWSFPWAASSSPAYLAGA